MAEQVLRVAVAMPILPILAQFSRSSATMDNFVE